MLNALGTFITKYRWWVIGVWVVLAVIITAFSPKLSSVESSNQTGFLSSKYESFQAQNIGNKSFPQSKDDVEILVVQRQDGGKLTATDKASIQTLAHQLNVTKLPKVVTVKTSAQEVSKDGTTQLVQIVVNSQASGGTSDTTFVSTVRSKVKQLVAGT